MRFLTRSLVGLFLLAATVGLLAFAGATVWRAVENARGEGGDGRPAEERVYAANVVTIRPETIRPVLTTFGEVRARRSLEVRAAAGGRIVFVSPNFEEGGRVGAGEVLVRVDPVDAEAEVETARADLSEADADLKDAERALSLAADDITQAEEQLALRERALQRQNDLLDRGVGSAQAVETAELAVSAARQALLSRRQAEASAEARVDQARIAVDRRRIALAEAERRLSETEVTAAFDGVLSDVNASVGRLISPNERLAELIDPSAVEVAFRVSTPQYARLLTDQGRLIGADVIASIDILGVDLEAKGTVSRESAAVGEGQTGRLLFARLEDAPGFRPGDFVTVRLEEPELEDVVRLPATAVSASGGVLVVGQEERLQTGEVELLRREGDDVIVRARDLNGREIVAERTPLLGAGIKIRPVRRDADGRVQAAAEAEMLSLDPERRARLVAFVEANDRMPEEAKARVLAQLREDRVPAEMVARIESRM